MTVRVSCGTSRSCDGGVNISDSLSCFVQELLFCFDVLVTLFCVFVVVLCVLLPWLPLFLWEKTFF